MKIAVNTRFLLNDYLEGYGYFLYETFRRITQNHPEHEFIFIFDRPFDKRFLFSPNISAVVAGPPARHPLLWKWWYNITLPRVFKKQGADLFVSCDGFCSLTASLPQCLVVHDLAFLHYPEFLKKSQAAYYKKNTPKFLEKAGAIATVSLFSKNDILANYPVDAEKIQVVYSAARDIFHPAEKWQKAKIKAKYTDEKEYFLYTGAIHPRKNLVSLLKAFSIFKKRQQSNFKLVLAGRLAWKYETFTARLKKYKYRDDVVMTGYLDELELAAVTAAAYAMVYPSLWEGFGVPILEAMRSDVPVITSAKTAMEEIAGDAALYANVADHPDLAEKMMRLYKDEGLRASLVQKGREVAAGYSWDKTAALLWETIIKCKPVNKP